MASAQSLANRKHWESADRNGPLAPDAAIEWNDIHWTPLTAEPRGVDYIEVNADGVSAMWILPKGAADDRVILYSHGGGFVSGSIYTHRKMVGHLAKAAGCRGLLFEFPYAHERKHPAQLDAAVTVYRSTRTLTDSRRSSCRPEATRPLSRTAGCSPSEPSKPVSRSGSMCSLRCCTASK